jgi:hypothetical protein
MTDIFNLGDDEEFEYEEPAVTTKDGVTCSRCGELLEDCMCEEVNIQYQPMQTDDGAVDHTTPTRMACMDQSRYYASKGWI